jgi:hypothetical protein
MTQYSGSDAFPVDFTIPDDSAPPTASNLLVSIEALGDRTKYLYDRLGAYRLANILYLGNDSPGPFTWSGANGDQGAYVLTHRLGIQSAASLQVNDIVDVTVSFCLLVNRVVANSSFNWRFIDSQNGGAYTQMVGSVQAYINPNGTDVTSLQFPVAMTSSRLITSAGNYAFALNGQVAAANTSFSIDGNTGLGCVMRVWRPN